jgi:hypothetical protein
VVTGLRATAMPAAAAARGREGLLKRQRRARMTDSPLSLLFSLAGVRAGNDEQKSPGPQGDGRAGAKAAGRLEWRHALACGSRDGQGLGWVTGWLVYETERRLFPRRIGAFEAPAEA